MKVYNLKNTTEFINKYIDNYEGQSQEVKEGSLGYGTTILYDGKNAKTFVIQEVFLNEWSSGHTIRGYNKMPKKYEKLLLN